MIIKSFEINKKKLDKKFFLFYGKNKGFIEETIQKSIKPFVTGNVFIYEENDILENPLNFQNSIYNTSFFDNEKLIIIKKVSDKIYEIISQIILKNLSEITLILITETLEKKSKLRIFFEKNTETFCVPFYEDSDKTLEIIANNFIQKKVKVFYNNDEKYGGFSEQITEMNRNEEQPRCSPPSVSRTPSAFDDSMWLCSSRERLFEECHFR